MEGEILGGRYEIVRELGRGGMGAVYEARHTGTGRRVALKIITTELVKAPGLVQRFEVEARAGGGIDSQYIAQVLDTGRDESRDAPYIVMEYLVGEDLSHLIARIAPVPVELALRIIAQSCLGMQKAHEAKIIHRDIKPANIFLNDREGDEIGIKILDFGVAKIRAEEGQNISVLTRTGSLLGSPLYMSPEQARGDKGIDHRSDVWALGVVLYEALSGRTPFHEIEALGSLIIAICSDPPPPIQQLAPWVPPQAAAIVHKALSLHPDARFQSSLEMYRAIKAVLPGGSHFVSRSMLVPLTADERAFVAPAMTTTEPALSSSGPGAYDDGGANRGASISGDRALPVAATSSAGAAAPPTDARAPLSMAPPPATERARTTAGVAREAAAPAGRSKVPLAIGVVVAIAAAGFAGARFASTGNGAPPAAAAPPSAPRPDLVAAEKAILPATAAASVTGAPTVAPAPAEAVTSSGDAGTASPAASAPRALKGPMPKPTTTAAPATTNVGGRIIRTDLP